LGDASSRDKLKISDLQGTKRDSGSTFANPTSRNYGERSKKTGTKPDAREFKNNFSKREENSDRQILRGETKSTACRTSTQKGLLGRKKEFSYQGNQRKSFYIV